MFQSWFRPSASPNVCLFTFQLYPSFHSPHPIFIFLFLSLHFHFSLSIFFIAVFPPLSLCPFTSPHLVVILLFFIYHSLLSFILISFHLSVSIFLSPHLTSLSFYLLSSSFILSPAFHLTPHLTSLFFFLCHLSLVSFVLLLSFHRSLSVFLSPHLISRHYHLSIFYHSFLFFISASSFHRLTSTSPSSPLNPHRHLLTSPPAPTAIFSRGGLVFSEVVGRYLLVNSRRIQEKSAKNIKPPSKNSKAYYYYQKRFSVFPFFLSLFVWEPRLFIFIPF